jgi:hypothetical protein
VFLFFPGLQLKEFLVKHREELKKQAETFVAFSSWYVTHKDAPPCMTG